MSNWAVSLQGIIDFLDLFRSCRPLPVVTALDQFRNRLVSLHGQVSLRHFRSSFWSDANVVLIHVGNCLPLDMLVLWRYI